MPKFLTRPPTFREVFFLGIASCGLGTGLIQYLMGKSAWRSLDDIFWTSPAIALPTAIIGLAYVALRLFAIPPTD
jgi:hypothetical protein